MNIRQFSTQEQLLYVVIYIDVNECKADICSQNCTNIGGTFQCSCEPGYFLTRDGVTCARTLFTFICVSLLRVSIHLNNQSIN